MNEPTEELKPCPFCGGKAAYGADALDTDFQYTFVMCGNCCSRGEESNYTVTGKGKDQVTAMKEARQAWNTRADDWQPIEDAPHDGTPVDIWLTGCRFSSCFFDPKSKFWISEDGFAVCEENAPTHFRPLPPAPGGEG